MVVGALIRPCGALFAVLLLLSGGARRSFAQLPVIPRARLDSIASPQRAPGSEAMRFDRERIETGRIGEEDAPSEYLFRWRNAGTEPLVVVDATTTCGCAVAAWSREPVGPGGEGWVRVTYHPRRHPGRFERRIFVYTQRSRSAPTAILTLAGEVIPAGVQPEEYPVAMGALRLRQRELCLSGDRPETGRIACMNGGKRPLAVAADTLFLPSFLSVACEPATFAPGAEGDLVIRFDPAKSRRRMTGRLPLLLAIDSLPPSQRTVELYFGDAPGREHE